MQGSEQAHGWSWEQLAFALGPKPEDGCEDPECEDCMRVFEEWMRMRAALGITHQIMGTA